jgi:hypothetical protein
MVAREIPTQNSDPRGPNVSALTRRRVLLIPAASRAQANAPQRLTRRGATPVARAIALILVAASAACQRSPSGPGAGISDSTFVAVLADLRLAVTPRNGVAIPPPPDTAALSHTRDSILRKYGVTAVGLESAASRLANHPDHAADIFGAIDHRVQLALAKVPVMPPAGSTPAGATAAPPSSLHPALSSPSTAGQAVPPGTASPTRAPAAVGPPGLLTRPNRPPVAGSKPTKPPARKPADSL